MPVDRENVAKHTYRYLATGRHPGRTWVCVCMRVRGCVRCLMGRAGAGQEKDYLTKNKLPLVYEMGMAAFRDFLLGSSTEGAPQARAPATSPSLPPQATPRFTERDGLLHAHREALAYAHTHIHSPSYPLYVGVRDAQPRAWGMCICCTCVRPVRLLLFLSPCAAARGGCAVGLDGAGP
jgi:hypothetical protein